MKAASKKRASSVTVCVKEVRGIKQCNSAQPFEVYIQSIDFNRPNSVIQGGDLDCTQLEYQGFEKLITDKVTWFLNVTAASAVTVNVNARYYDSIEKKDKGMLNRPWPVVLDTTPGINKEAGILVETMMQNVPKGVVYRIIYDVWPSSGIRHS